MLSHRRRLGSGSVLAAGPGTGPGKPDRRGRPGRRPGMVGGRGDCGARAVASRRSPLLRVSRDLEAQEKRDRVPAGTYRRLAESGALRVAEGLRVQPPAALYAAIRAAWGRVEVVICDRFRLPELQDCINGTPVSPRVARWSEAAADIRALRKSAADGPLSCEPGSRALLTASLAGAMVKNDEQGNTRLAKRGTNNTARDDVAAALVLAAGALARAPKPRRGYHGLAG